MERKTPSTKIGAVIALFLLLIVSAQAQAQHSVARQWNEALLEGIRNDFARPTVHARNLFHTSILMYDTWAVYDQNASTYFMGRNVHGYRCDFDGLSSTPTDVNAAIEETMSYAVYRLLRHRFELSPGADETRMIIDNLMAELGYDINLTSTDYSTGSVAALGNYMASCMIAYGLQDGSNEANAYANQFYEPRNPPLLPVVAGNPDIIDPNYWQPLTLDIFIDQGGNVIPGETPDFLSPEWGFVSPFAMTNDDLTIYNRDGHDYWVYNDPGAPPLAELGVESDSYDQYKWGFSLVSLWSAHLDPADGVMWDISPAVLGNIDELPQTFAEYHDFYDAIEGGDPSMGHEINPHTGQPYPQNLVPRGDYTRVLAEFWADGPDSETPPGHWFTILNYVMDHPEFEFKYRGSGPDLDPLEYEVKAYFALGGAMHDAAISAWSVKGWYDYLRPISAIRSMADRGQSSDPNLPGYSVDGIPLVPGLIELIEEGDPIAGSQNQNVGKIKLYAWKGPNFIDDPVTDVAGVGWIVSDIWWPYQRPSFVTPPFAGYVSGHSTYSRAAAEILTLLTGDEYFPGGVGEFVAPQNEFLVFEEGPSVDILLQWATYRDASDQTSLSRIWGGIHPPADDIPGRIMGIKIGLDAFDLADRYFNGRVLSREERLPQIALASVYPNPVTAGQVLNIQLRQPQAEVLVQLSSLDGRQITSELVKPAASQSALQLELQGLGKGIYLLQLSTEAGQQVQRIQID